MPVAFVLTATGRDGAAHTFQDAELDHDANARTWAYRVRVAGTPDFYEAKFAEVAGGVQPVALARNDAVFRGKGIAEALFLRVVADSGQHLFSSTNAGQKNFPNEFRSVSAERIWRWLFGEERATYDAAQDRYTFVPQGTARGCAGE
jgi:hypothetical protein